MKYREKEGSKESKKKARMIDLKDGTKIDR